MSKKSQAPAVNMAIDILESLATDSDQTLTQVCVSLGIPKSTGYRILSVLESRGWVHREDDTRRYRMTPLKELNYGALVLGSRLGMGHAKP